MWLRSSRWWHLFGAGLTFFEYASTYPGLVEFRDAPPFNRIRFASLSDHGFDAVVPGRRRHQCRYTPVTEYVTLLGATIGQAIDFPYSPVSAWWCLMLPADAPVAHVHLVRNAAGLAYLTSLLTLFIFIVFQRIRQWPLQHGSFNVWVNLPTFRPHRRAAMWWIAWNGTRALTLR